VLLTFLNLSKPELLGGLAESAVCLTVLRKKSYGM